MSYRVSTLDPKDDSPDMDWRLYASGLPLMGLRRAIRECRDAGYDDEVSILVEREGAE